MSLENQDLSHISISMFTSIIPILSIVVGVCIA